MDISKAETTREPEIVLQVCLIRRFVDDCLKLTHELEERLTRVLHASHPEPAGGDNPAVVQGTTTTLGGELHDIRKTAEVASERLRKIIQRIEV